RAAWGAIGRRIDQLRPTIDAQKSLQSKAADLIASIQDLRLGTRLQIDNSVTWPFLSILVSWPELLFFGFGLLPPLNTAAVFPLAVSALSLASAISLIHELAAPYSGVLRLPAPLFFRRVTLLPNNQSSPPWDYAMLVRVACIMDACGLGCLVEPAAPSKGLGIFHN